MTDRERAFADIGFEYAEGIDQAKVVIVPSTGREIRKTAKGTWECQPWNDNYWQEFDDLLDAARFATRPKDPAGFAARRIPDLADELLKIIQKHGNDHQAVSDAFQGYTEEEIEDAYQLLQQQGRFQGDDHAS